MCVCVCMYRMFSSFIYIKGLYVCHILKLIYVSAMSIEHISIFHQNRYSNPPICNCFMLPYIRIHFHYGLSISKAEFHNEFLIRIPIVKNRFHFVMHRMKAKEKYIYLYLTQDPMDEISFCFYIFISNIYGLLPYATHSQSDYWLCSLLDIELPTENVSDYKRFGFSFAIFFCWQIVKDLRDSFVLVIFCLL